MLLAQFIPRIMNYTAIILGTLVMVGLCVCLALYPTKYTAAKWICFVVFLVPVLIIIFKVFFNSKVWAVNGILLEEASRMVCDRISVLGYIPIFILVTVAFAFMMIY